MGRAEPARALSAQRFRAGLACGAPTALEWFERRPSGVYSRCRESMMEIPAQRRKS